MRCGSSGSGDRVQRWKGVDLARGKRCSEWWCLPTMTPVRSTGRERWGGEGIGDGSLMSKRCERRDRSPILPKSEAFTSESRSPTSNCHRFKLNWAYFQFQFYGSSK